jgi:glutathione synthase/RimK-type ligase-like ATP-grasp enzyme
MKYDLCLAWNWEYDAGFVRLLEASCTRHGLTLFQVTPHNLEATLAALRNGELGFRVFFDRASDSDPRFQPFVDCAKSQDVICINPQEQARWTWDKATMHLEFITHGLNTPYTIILPPFSEQPHIPVVDLSPLGGCFAIKPAVGGGGWGVVLEAKSMDQVHAARQEYPQEKVLLQAHVEQARLDGRPAWFRVLVCSGAVYPCWWDPKTRIYSRVTADESFRYGLRLLHEIPARIAQICKLDLFSTEIALKADGQFVVTDYVNDPIDLRLQTEAVDGVPDAIVGNITRRLIWLVDSK